ncbi:hypothetical protein ACP3XN_29240, partial [Salmonella enterica]
PSFLRQEATLAEVMDSPAAGTLSSTTPPDAGAAAGVLAAATGAGASAAGVVAVAAPAAILAITVPIATSSPS